MCCAKPFFVSRLLVDQSHYRSILSPPIVHCDFLSPWVGSSTVLFFGCWRYLRIFSSMAVRTSILCSGSKDYSCCLGWNIALICCWKTSSCRISGYSCFHNYPCYLCCSYSRSFRYCWLKPFELREWAWCVLMNLAWRMSPLYRNPVGIISVGDGHCSIYLSLSLWRTISRYFLRNGRSFSSRGAYCSGMSTKFVSEIKMRAMPV